MIVCPSCKHEEFEGALFCNECGAQLPGTPQTGTKNIQRMAATETLQPLRPKPTETRSSSGAPPTTSIDAPIAIYVMDAGQIIPLAGRDEFTLGRSSEQQTVLPDLDLSPFQAYEKGVSRLHASIRVNSNPVTVTDLGSVNATRLNGQRIPPSKPIPVQHGDILTLGKLKLQMIIRK